MHCNNVDAALEFYKDQLGFRIDMIFPADAPRVVQMSGYGIGVRIETDKSPGSSPDGAWHAGRAGMQYRDLIPDRLGGRLIASHVRIPEGGPVADYVHYHDVQLQVIYCYTGWVKVVYEDQGPPFVMRPGDCVLQPPHIRHRVLECSDGMEVVEVSSPAQHETFADHELQLPTDTLAPRRDFGGQRFVFHVAREAAWHTGLFPGFEMRDTGVSKSTRGNASVRVLRAQAGDHNIDMQSSDETRFFFVLRGKLTRISDGERSVIRAGEAFLALPATALKIRDVTAGMELLLVALRD